MEDILQKMEEEPGFFHHNHYHVAEIGNDFVLLRADLDEDSLNPYGFAHGGLIFGLGDTAMGMIAARGGRKAVTLTSNINFLKKGKGKFITAKAEIIKEGKSTSFTRANIYDEEKTLIAVMDANYYYINEKEG